MTQLVVAPKPLQKIDTSAPGSPPRPKPKPTPWRFYALVWVGLSLALALLVAAHALRSWQLAQASRKNSQNDVLEPYLAPPKPFPEIRHIEDKVASLETKIDRVLLTAQETQRSVMDATKSVAKAAEHLSEASSRLAKVSDNMSTIIGDLKGLRDEPRTTTVPPKIPLITPAVFTPKAASTPSLSYTPAPAAPKAPAVERVVYVYRYCYVPVRRCCFFR